MFRTFNMGIGMVVICSATDKQAVIDQIGGISEIGEVVTGQKEVHIA